MDDLGFDAGRGVLMCMFLTMAGLESFRSNY
jgi:hypothetical protein